MLVFFQVCINILVNFHIFNLGSLFNYRHPGPRRVWKVGSELQSTTLDPVDPVDPLLCPKVWFRVRETLLFALWPAAAPKALPKIAKVHFLVTKTAPARQRGHPLPTFIEKVHFLVTKTAPARQRGHPWPTYVLKI